MAVWIYRALDSKGKSLQGVLEADSERHARTVLRERHLKPLQVAASAADAEVPGARGWFRRGRKLDSR
ncbi:MAG TPA: type II secretion system protein GspF, partial [Pseudomonadaceae bacterium]|nr:type II secretion system protein GspF [Pseudomonadaceae bacterium]